MMTSTVAAAVITRRNREVFIFITGLLAGFGASSCLVLFVVTNKALLHPPATSCTPLHPQMGVGVPRLLPQSSGLSSDDPHNNNNKDSSDGWKTIHVFFGKTDHLADVTTLPTPYFQANRWFSQFRQDEIIAQLFRNKKNGYFIDLAANDAVRISNTYALETFYGWKGLCLEPNSIYWASLAYRQCHVVAAVIGNQTMQSVHFHFPKDKAPQGGIIRSIQNDKVGQHQDMDKNNQVKQRGLTTMTQQQRYTVSLVDIFQRFHVPPMIDYLSLDVEGAEDFIMSSFPFDRYQIRTMTVERPSPSLRARLTQNGYIPIKTIKANVETLWIHALAKDELNMDALRIDSANYKYRESTAQERIAPETKLSS